MNTLNGLKKLLAKLGGNPDEVNNNGDAVDAIAEAYADHVGAVIDDTKASEDTVYSSSKVESIVPEIDDTTASETKVYSSSKVASLIPAGSTTERGYVFGSSTIGNAHTKLIPMRETILFYMLIEGNVMLLETGKKTNDETYVLEVRDSVNQVSYLFYRQNLESPSVWLNISRTQNATVYKSFEIADTDGDGDMKPITTVTVNDPT